MAAEGLSVKERLALLQSNNKNPQLNGEIKTSPTTSHKPPGPKPKPPAADAKPSPSVPALKPVNKINTPNRFGSGAPSPAVPPKSPLTPPNKSERDAASNKVNGQENASAFSKLRPVGSGVGGKGVTPLVPKKPSGSTSDSGGSGDGVIMREKEDSSNASRPLSIQERMAALKEKADKGSDSSLSSPSSSSCKENSGGVTSPTKSPTSPGINTAKSLGRPPKPATTPLSKQANGCVTTGASTTPLKPSDIIKSINQAAADKVNVRDKPPGSGAGIGRKSSEVYLRNSDGKKFRKVAVGTVTSTFPAPPKPEKIENVDLASFLKAYATAKEAKIKADAAKSDLPDGAGETDELYVEAESEVVPVATRNSLNRARSVRISQIPEYTEEEEKEEWYTDGSSGIPPGPEEMYDDCESANQPGGGGGVVPEEPDEIYEPLDDAAEEAMSESSSQPSPPSPKTKKEKEKEKEKDKEKEKEKEKAGKKKDKGKEEKERKKKEEELKKLRAKFGLNEGDEKVGDGVVKANSGGGVFSKDLSVTKGEIIAILRMDGNPAGKWLAQSEAGKIGYVNSNNIEISTPTIRHVLHECTPQSNLMGGLKAEAQNEEDPEEYYEPLPEGEMDEIYEEM